MQTMTPRPTRGLTIGILVALVVAACSQAGPGAPTPAPTTAAATPAAASVIPVVVSTQQVVGENRFLFSFLDTQTNRPVAAPDRSASVRFLDLATEPGTEIGRATGTFIWGLEDVTGVYVVHQSFAVAGPHAAEFTTQAAGGPAETIRVRFDVQADGSAIGIGEAAPASDTPTVDDVGGDLERISTDPAPDGRFYERSVAEALAAKQAFVLVFATPAFCQTAMCGPALDRVKPLADEFPEIAFINVEPYQLEFAEGRLQPRLDANNQLQAVPSVLEWGILTEPYVFVVDGTGVVRASFEGFVGDDELRQAIQAVAG